MQEYLFIVKGEAVEFKLNKTAKTKTEIENYRKSFESSFESSYEAMFHDNTAGGLLDGIYTDPDSTIEVYKGLDVDDTKPIFSINIQEVVNTVKGEVIDEGFVGLCESSRGTVGYFLINLPEDELFDPRNLAVHISTLETANGNIDFATGFSYKGFEGSSDELDFVKGKDAALILDFGYMELNISNQEFVYNFNNKPKLLTQQQLNKAAVKYYQQWESKEKNLFNLFKKDVITVESVKRAASYFSIARSFPGNDIRRWESVIDALSLIEAADINPFNKVHQHIQKSMNVKNVPSATSKFIFLRKRNHSLPIYDSVVKKSLGLRANCSYTEFQAAFNLVFIEYQKELKIACNKINDDIARQAWFQMRVLDAALWELGSQK